MKEKLKGLGNGKILLYGAAFITGMFFLVWGLLEAQGVLGPLVTALILALVILPVGRWLEKYMSRSYASLLSTFALFLLSLAFAALLSYQAKVFVESWPDIQETMAPKVEQWKSYVTQKTFLEQQDLPSGKNLPLVGSGESGKGMQIAGIFGRSTGYLGTYLLTFIYIFFMLNYRRRFRAFLLRLFNDDRHDEVNDVVRESADVVQQYLVGKLILTALLAAAYAVGLGISGVSNFILVSVVAALFTLIPYIGNIIGFGMALVFGYLTSGETSVLVGVIITFAAAQFLESYVLQPFIVGDKVDVHPFFIILAVIVGNALWGIIGMILAIPLMGIVTIVFLHVPALRPYGFLFSDKGTSIDE